MTEVLTAGIISIPPTIAALAAWRNAKATKEQTNGALHDPLTRIEATLQDVLHWQIKHDRRHDELGA